MDVAAIETAFRARTSKNRAQETAFERFAKLGLPHRRVEGWKWSDMSRALSGVPVSGPDSGDVVSPSAFVGVNPLEFRIIGGRIELPEEPAPEGVRYGVMDPVGTIEDLEKHPVALLNVAMTAKALGFEIMDGVSFDRPVLIRHIAPAAGFSFSQAMLRFGEGSSGTIIETFEGEATGFSSHLTHMVVRDGAKATRYLMDSRGAGAITHEMCAVKVEANAALTQSALNIGSKLSRHESLVHFWGEGATAHIDSASLVTGERHADFTSIIEHKAPNCVVRQRHKGVAAEKGRNVFQGKFLVERPAQKTDAKMNANAMLLSDTAEASHKPELEIYADDVECAHGSTAGALDDDALFYLRQRGLTEHQARALLIEAFVGEVIDHIENENIREVFSGRVQQWLEAV